MKKEYGRDTLFDVLWLWLGIILLPFDLIHQIIIDKENNKK